MEQEVIKVDYKDKKTLDLLKNTVAQGTTDQEFDLFCRMAQSTGLNPIKKEVWCIVTGSGQYRKVQMMTGVNGFYAIANSNPQYDGMELEYGPLFDIKLPENQEGVGAIKAPEYVDCKTYRKDRRFPQVARAYWHEYAKDLVTKGYEGKPGKLGIWAKMSSVMLAKCAESMSLRKSFPQELNGFYSQEEMPSDFKLQDRAIEVSQKYLPISQKEVEKYKDSWGNQGSDLGACSLEDDEIPESFLEAAPLYPFKYDLARIEEDDKMESLAKYKSILNDSGVSYYENTQEMILYSAQELKKLKNYKIKE